MTTGIEAGDFWWWIALLIALGICFSILGEPENNDF